MRVSFLLLITADSLCNWPMPIVEGKQSKGIQVQKTESTGVCVFLGECPLGCRISYNNQKGVSESSEFSRRDDAYEHKSFVLCAQGEGCDI